MEVALEAGKVDVCNSDIGIHVTPTRQIGRHFRLRLVTLKTDVWLHNVHITHKLHKFLLGSVGILSTLLVL